MLRGYLVGEPSIARHTDIREIAGRHYPFRYNAIPDGNIAQKRILINRSSNPLLAAGLIPEGNVCGKSFATAHQRNIAMVSPKESPPKINTA